MHRNLPVLAPDLPTLLIGLLIASFGWWAVNDPPLRAFELWNPRIVSYIHLSPREGFGQLE